MPCFTEPLTKSEERRYHEQAAVAIMEQLWRFKYVENFPQEGKCVQALCRFTKTVKPANIARMQEMSPDLYQRLRDWTRDHVHVDIDDKVEKFRRAITPLIRSRFKTL